MVALEYLQNNSNHYMSVFYQQQQRTEQLFILFWQLITYL